MTADEHGIVRRSLKLSELQWLFPEEAIRKLRGLALLCGIDPEKRGKPLPASYRLEILGRIVHSLRLPQGKVTPEGMREAFDSLDLRDRDYLQNLLQTSLQELEDKLARQPGTPLGFPPGNLALWSNLLDRGWIPMPENAVFPANDGR